MNAQLISEKKEPSYRSSFPDSLIFQRLTELGEMVVEGKDVSELFRFSLDAIIELFSFERAAIILTEDNVNLEPVLIRTISKETVNNIQVFKELVDRVSETNIIHGVHSTAENQILPLNRKNNFELFLNKLCLPLNNKGIRLGFLYVDNIVEAVSLNSEKLKFIMIFAKFLTPVIVRAISEKNKSCQTGELEKELRREFNFDFIIGHHPEIIKNLKIVSQVADTDATVLIQGESGTGKELIAQAIHFNSRRRNEPFVPINCGALSENILESELFGHEKGAFTGAIRDKNGWFEAAEGGTIFLDEVHEMSPALQVKLLRVLQSGQYSRVGSTTIKMCDVRIVAATTIDLKDLIGKNSFRDELYYRLNVVDIKIPPLRKRKNDIPLLTRHFLKTYASKYRKKDLVIEDPILSLLIGYHFPGNVRELENIIERAVVLSEGKTINFGNLPETIVGKLSERSWMSPLNFKHQKQQLIEEFEEDFLEECLMACNGNISKAAKLSGLHFTNFYSKMKKYKIDKYVLGDNEEKL